MADVIVALDQPTRAEALRLVERLPGLRWVKVGPTLFLDGGPALLRDLKARGLSVFLDLKWHDIPHQVAGAVRAAAGLGVDLATVHAVGGRRMLDAAREAAGRLRLVAVTVLTSHDERSYAEAMGRQADLLREAVRLAELARACGLAGAVASPVEVARLRDVWPDGWRVVPGIRLPGSAPDDQRRTAEPAAAVRDGATHLVVGRPITGAEDPLAVYQGLCDAAG